MATTQTADGDIDSGQFARDADQIDDDDEDELVIVLERTGKPIDQIEVYREPNGTVHTVEEWNPDYNPSDEGVEVVYRSSVEPRFDGSWTVRDVLAAYREGTLTTPQSDGGHGLTTYTMPIGRLKPVGGSDA